MTTEPDPLPRALSLAVHELRTPISVVAGYLRMLLREQGGPLTDAQRRMLEEADRSCSRINTLVSEMSELGKLESGDVSIANAPFDLSALIAEVASNMQEGKDRGIRLDVQGTDSPIMVMGDRARLSAALKALMHAALRERGTPGLVLVRCSTNPDTNEVTIAIGEEAVVQELVDAARGVPAPFDEWRGGLGLALPVGLRVVRAHGGTIWSAEGRGNRGGSALRLPVQAPSTF